MNDPTTVYTQASSLLVINSTQRAIMSESFLFVFFFFQAEDGIRDLTVTGVQTCALPISEEPLQPVPLGDVHVASDVDVAQALRMDAYLGGAEPTAIPVGLYTSGGLDRKSTRLNSSHSQISYAVFCLKKKKITNDL